MDGHRIGDSEFPDADRETNVPAFRKKIQSLLRQRYPDQPVPSRTTIYNVLKQAGHVKPRSVRRRRGPTCWPTRSSAA